MCIYASYHGHPRLHGADGAREGHEEPGLRLQAAAVPEVAELRRVLDGTEVRQQLVGQGLDAQESCGEIGDRSL